MTNQLIRRLIVGAFLAVLGFFLLTEHRAHVFGVLPYLFLFACPLFHLILHRRHGHHEDEQEGRSGQRGAQSHE